MKVGEITERTREENEFGFRMFTFALLIVKEADIPLGRFYNGRAFKKHIVYILRKHLISLSLRRKIKREEKHL